LKETGSERLSNGSPLIMNYPALGRPKPPKEFSIRGVIVYCIMIGAPIVTVILIFIAIALGVGLGVGLYKQRSSNEKAIQLKMNITTTPPTNTTAGDTREIAINTSTTSKTTIGTVTNYRIFKTS
jgi:hypothetical protein